MDFQDKVIVMHDGNRSHALLSADTFRKLYNFVRMLQEKIYDYLKIGVYY